MFSHLHNHKQSSNGCEWKHMVICESEAQKEEAAVIKKSEFLKKNAGCKCTRAIFILSDSAFIFITAIDMAKWIFQQFLQSHYALFHWSICCSENMEIGGRRVCSCVCVCCMKRVYFCCWGLDYQLWIQLEGESTAKVSLSIVMIYPWQLPLAAL